MKIGLDTKYSPGQVVFAVYRGDFLDVVTVEKREIKNILIGEDGEISYKVGNMTYDSKYIADSEEKLGEVVESAMKELRDKAKDEN